MALSASLWLRLPVPLGPSPYRTACPNNGNRLRHPKIPLSFALPEVLQVGLASSEKPSVSLTRNKTIARSERCTIYNCILIYKLKCTLG